MVLFRTMGSCELGIFTNNPKYHFVMNTVTPWALSASSELALVDEPILKWFIGGFDFALHPTMDSLWIIVKFPKGGKMNFRVAYSPGGSLAVKSTEKKEMGAVIDLGSATGHFRTIITLELENDYPVLRYTTSLKPNSDLFIPFWPRDIVGSSNSGTIDNTTAKIYASQEGTRTGFLYLSMTRPKSGSVFYMQNLTSLADYCEQTETSAANVVGGQWPEVGFALPCSLDKYLKAGKEVIISDAIVTFDEEVPKDEAGMIRQYLNMLATVYIKLPKPETVYQDWPVILGKGLQDLKNSPGCWSQIDGHKYLNAYFSDHDTPPEIMVQLAVLLPLVDYVAWSGDQIEMIDTIKDGLEAFYNKELKTIMRWLPAAEDKLEGEEEQKIPLVMDSWYLHHPLLNLSRLAIAGDKLARQLFLDSVDFAIGVAHEFNYQWPVFYKMDSLEIVKAETSEGEGGEKDVPGLYAHVMLQAWELTGEKRFLNEAEKAAKSLQGLGFDVFYQANNTAFSAGALLRLYKITSNKLYLDLSYMCLAGVFRNTQLWECNYGYGKHFPTFFALFPLNDAPYTAAYEEQEVFCALHDYLKHAEGVPILPSIQLLITEFIRNLVNRAVFYYPTMLPKEMLEEKPKIGALDTSLWIALEDLHDGWEKSGSVGQEVYGAGNAFGIVPRHFHKVPGEEFMVYVDYPITGFSKRRNKKLSFKIVGDSRLGCKLMLVKKGRAKLPEFTVQVNGKSEILKGRKVQNGNVEFLLKGDWEVVIGW